MMNNWFVLPSGIALNMDRINDIRLNPHGVYILNLGINDDAGSICIDNPKDVAAIADWIKQRSSVQPVRG